MPRGLRGRRLGTKAVDSKTLECAGSLNQTWAWNRQVQNYYVEIRSYVRVDFKKLKHGCRVIYVGVPSLVLGSR